MTNRKTIAVSEVVSSVNFLLANSDADLSELRQGAINVLESILHKTGNYRGFRYLTEVADGKPGVNYVTSNGSLVPHPDYTKRFADTDCTRIEYFG